MPRRSSRAVPAPAAAPAPIPKRRASDRISAASKTDPKRQRYNSTTAKKAVRSTARKSKYFEDEGNEESDPESSHAFEVEEDSGSAYEDTKLSSPSTESDSEELEALSTDEERKKRSATKTADPGGGRKTPARRGKGNEEEDHPNEDIAASLKDKELWREGVSTGLGPGKEVFIKKPKARDPGDIPYQDHTLHPNTMLFLQDLAKHNDRQWLKAHDADYRASKKDWETFVESLTEKISELDNTIPELPAKDIVFRIHRDIRFSKDPTPYKIVGGLTIAMTRRTFQLHGHAPAEKAPMPLTMCICNPDLALSGFCTRTGLPSFRLDSGQPLCLHHFTGLRRRLWLLRELVTTMLPESCPLPPLSLGHDVLSSQSVPFTGSGLWQPEADKLALLREDIDHNSHRLKAVLRRPDMRREFFNGIPDDEKKAVQAFVSQNKESALKTKPKGYEADNENIELLRLRSFTIGKPLSDSEFMASNVQERLAAIVGVMEPFVTYLNSVVMPDPVEQDSGSESDFA
ncbi:hypothetical protein CNMCM6936_000670 [Aspergillus lentulus]|nr:hypothetical protein CNMCM6069_001000 [Aspergillus lentulus]KAF4163486.1 hypothetical protein CNMCM6936_000670 [Aspergillus lentulus]KAF4173106.1 hypothetical protein CNMCM8060_000592 [Aspergillus lentulus]KAF4184026.1 hypothetical protein CNMCM7927_008410 [Aspergillus lentulus]KAF4191799.1 hypothetical protein CNMCM8694_001338 [Aspergillus lentulus]